MAVFKRRRGAGEADRPLEATRWAALVLLAIATAIVLVATLCPTPIDRGYRSQISRFLSVLHEMGVPEWFAYAQLEFSANIVMFTPLGFLLALALPRRRWWLAVILPFLGSIAIEITQGGLLHERYASAADVAANTIGAAVGLGLALVARALVHARDRAVRASTARAMSGQTELLPVSGPASPRSTTSE